MATKYVLQDRLTHESRPIQVTDRGLVVGDVTGDTVEAEPIFMDRTNPSDHYRLFVEDRILQIETVATLQDDLLFLEDTISGITYRVLVDDRALTLEASDPVEYLTAVMFSSTLAGVVPELSDGQYGLLLKDSEGTAVSKTQVTKLEVTLRNLDGDLQGIINSRDAFDAVANSFAGFVTMGATDGKIRVNLTQLDNVFVADPPGARQRYERHLLVLDIEALGQRILHRVEFKVENIEGITV